MSTIHSTDRTGDTTRVATGPGSDGHLTTLRRRWPTGLGIALTAPALLLLSVLPEEVAFSISAWCVLLAAVIYLTWGTHRGELSHSARLGAQTVAVLGFGAAAVAAVAVDRELGTYVLAAGWLAHAAWDVAHHRMNAVVPRWYAETCLVADIVVAGALLVSTAV